MLNNMDTLSDKVKLVQIFLACCTYADRGYKKFIPVSLYRLDIELTIVKCPLDNQCQKVSLNDFYLTYLMVSTVKIHQTFISTALLIALFDGDNSAHEYTMRANLLNTLNLTVKTDQCIC